jgi:chromosome segregation protein
LLSTDTVEFYLNKSFFDIDFIFLQAMKLKTLEIKGFKSFANQTIINFNEEVIGIVGPNGSGKSNIVDAIRWVLGEQKSRELRLEQMQDVIFNGTNKRKQAGIAQVTLTFENTKNLLPTAYNTVAISRLLYRSGESEYQLNGVNCRLKDITNLFLDTGIGSNSYAIIALGMVDDILDDKEDSRRKMFEQAAGVSKYKIRKREALSKLKSASEDLDRVEDLLHEIDGNLKSLEKQAKRTKKYFDLKNEYKELSIELSLLKVSVLKKQYVQFKKDIDDLQDDYRTLDFSIQKEEAALELLKKTHLDKEIWLSEHQKDLNEIISNLRNLENEKKLTIQRQQFISENEKKLEEEILRADDLLLRLKEEIVEVNIELNLEKRVSFRLEQELDAAQKELDEIKNNHTEAKSLMDNILLEQNKFEKSVVDLEKLKAVNQSQIDNLSKANETQQNELNQIMISMDSLSSEVDKLLVDELTQQEFIKGIDNKEQIRLEKLAQLEIQKDIHNQDLVKIRRELDASRNELKLTKSMVDNLEGFPESIHFLTKQKEWNNKIPLLTDIIYVDEKYRVAIENFLEPFLNYFVVNDYPTALQAVDTLIKAQKGKANFFVLSSFETYILPLFPQISYQRAIDLVQVDEPYSKLCNYLLEGVYMVEPNQSIFQLPESNLVFLHTNGQFTNRKHSLSGGSIGLFEGKKIGRKKNLVFLEESISKKEKEEDRAVNIIHQLKNEISTILALNNQKELSEEKQKLQKIIQQRISTQSRKDGITQFVQDLRIKMEGTQNQIETASSNLEKVLGSLEIERRFLDQAKEKIALTDGNFRGLAERLSNVSTLYNDRNIQFLRQENKVEGCQRELNNKEKQIIERQNTIYQNKITLQKSIQENDYLTANLTKFTNQIQEILTLKSSRQLNITEAETQFFEERNQIVSLEDLLRKQNKDRQAKQIAVNTLKESFNDTKFEISSLSQRLRIEFEVNVNDILNIEPKGLGSMEELIPQVEKMKVKLDNYGEVNPLAIEAFDEMQERYTNILTQKNDILDAKLSLEKTLNEIEQTATIRFLEAFTQVRTHFIEVFRSLFTDDDNCDLILVDPNNPLDSKIEIIAKPKGKKPQSISQLSGGEKTLTAIALLFSLYLLKPAPFCIFDEVDAPLDDTNISKFNKIIKKFSGESQFIIVTHNKLTMASVQTIYGVYMEEQGVSGIAAVDLREYQIQESVV